MAREVSHPWPPPHDKTESLIIKKSKTMLGSRQGTMGTMGTMQGMYVRCGMLEVRYEAMSSVMAERGYQKASLSLIYREGVANDEEGEK